MIRLGKWIIRASQKSFCVFRVFCGSIFLTDGTCRLTQAEAQLSRVLAELVRRSAICPTKKMEPQITQNTQSAPMAYASPQLDRIPCQWRRR